VTDVTCNDGRTNVTPLCLSPGLTVPPHSHPGLETTPQPLKGKDMLPVGGGKEVTLVPGEVLFIDGANFFNPRNPFHEDFEMLDSLKER